MKFRFGIIGCGRIAPRHVAAIKSLEGCEVVAGCDNVPEILDQFCEEHGVTKKYTDYHDLLKDKNVDVVVICTPSGLHAQMTIDAAKAKKHVVTEKPMAMELKDADAMIKACEDNKVRLFVVKQNRYNPPVVKLFNALKKGRFGKLLYLNTNVLWCRPQSYYDMAEWRGSAEQDGGILLNQASHHVDLLRWIGGEVKSVYAKLDTIDHDIEVPDIALIIMKFKNGAYGTITATNCTYPKNMEGSVTVLGTKGCAKVGGFAVNKIDHWDFQDYENDDEMIMDSSTLPPDVYGFGHKEVYKNVVGSLRTGKNAFVDGFEGRTSLELIEAIYESAKSSKEVEIDKK